MNSLRNIINSFSFRLLFTMLAVSLLPLAFLGLISMFSTKSALDENSNEISNVIFQDVITIYKDNITAQAQQINLELQQIENAVMFVKTEAEIIYGNEENYPIDASFKLRKFSDKYYWDAVLGNDVSNTNVIGKTNITDKMKENLARSIYLEPFFRQAIKQNQHISAIYFITADSSTRIFPAMDPNTEINEKFLDPDIPVTTYPFYQTAIKAPIAYDKIRWTDPYLDITHRSDMFSATTAVKQNGHLLGVISADVTIETVVNDLLNNKFWDIPNGYSFIVNKYGEAIAVQDNGKDHYSEVLSSYNIINKPGENADITYLKDGYILLTSEIKNTGWYLGYAIKKDSIVSPIQEKTMGSIQTVFKEITSNVIWTSTMLLIICIGVSLFLWRTMTIPINELVVGISEIGDESINVKVRQPKMTEFQKVIVSFNSMSAHITYLLQELRQRLVEKEVLHDKLVKLNQELEKKVDDRTEKLQSANNALIEKNNELKEMAKSKSDLFSNISHDLKTPLTLASGYIDALVDGLIPREKHHDYLRKVQDKIFSVNRLVKDIYEISLLESKTNLLQKEAIVASEVICILKEKWTNDYLTSDGIHLLFNCKQETLDYASQFMMVVDIEYLNRAIANLIDNAFKYGDKDSVIVLEIKGNNNQLIIAVTNHGEPIPEDYFSEIFKRSYRIDKSRNSSIQGHGLGLSIVKEIVELQKGTITVKSDKQEGTTFTMCFPLKMFNEKNFSIF